LWVEIVEARPADYFQPGSLYLLEQFCMIAVVQRSVLAKMARAAKAGNIGEFSDAVRVAKDLAGVLNATATKLRITVQSTIDRKSAQRHETEPQIENGAHLLGGGPRVN
jgi:hypothetical protein